MTTEVLRHTLMRIVIAAVLCWTAASPAQPSGECWDWLKLRNYLDGSQSSHVYECLAQGADPNARDDEDNYTPLDYVRHWDTAAPLIRILVLAGADPEIRERNGFTVLNNAVVHSGVESVRALLEAGADPNARLKNSVVNGRPTLHLAAGIWVEARDWELRAREAGRTDLVRMWQESRAEMALMVKELIRYGADPEAADNSGVAIEDWMPAEHQSDWRVLVAAAGR